MNPTRVILRFSFFVLLFYTLLMIPWPGLQSAYSGAFRTGGDVFFRRFWAWSDGRVRFLDLHSEFLMEDLKSVTLVDPPPGFRLPPPTDVMDTLMVMSNRGVPGPYGVLRTSSRPVGYWPTAWMLALILAKPMSWSRRGWALLWGLLLVHVFIVVRLSLTLANNGFGAAKSYALFEMSPFWKDVLARAETVLLTDPTATFAIATFIWLLVSVKRSEWAWLREMLLPVRDDD
ncbi:MAG: hypothetical protein JSU63_21770 [Phycisphaerales bacterium]|nr:MAG: hypothetical protein JSU63_21770 [Phycisphaerales bacterium]